MVKRLKAGPARFVHWHYVDGWRPKLWLAMTTETTRKRVGGLDKPEICFQSEINFFMFLNYFTPYIFSTVLQLQFSQSLDFCQSIHFFQFFHILSSLIIVSTSGLVQPVPHFCYIFHQRKHVLSALVSF